MSKKLIFLCFFITEQLFGRFGVVDFEIPLDFYEYIGEKMIVSGGVLQDIDGVNKCLDPAAIDVAKKLRAVVFLGTFQMPFFDFFFENKQSEIDRTREVFGNNPDFLERFEQVISFKEEIIANLVALPWSEIPAVSRYFASCSLANFLIGKWIVEQSPTIENLSIDYDQEIIGLDLNCIISELKFACSEKVVFKRSAAKRLFRGILKAFQLELVVYKMSVAYERIQNRHLKKKEQELRASLFKELPLDF